AGLSRESPLLPTQRSSSVSPPPSPPYLFLSDAATTEIYTLSLHDALPICTANRRFAGGGSLAGEVELGEGDGAALVDRAVGGHRSEEHTSELQSRENLVCRLLLEKKKA